MRRRMALSSACDTLARCFFRGLPTAPPFSASPIDFNEPPGPAGGAAVVVGGVVEIPDVVGVSPGAGLADSVLGVFGPSEADECWRFN